MADILIAHGTVITLDPRRRVIEDGAVAIRGDRIVAVDTHAALAESGPFETTLDARNMVVLPGLVDCHAHAGHGLVKTLGGDDGEAWYRACEVFYTRASSPEFWAAEAALAALRQQPGLCRPFPPRLSRYPAPVGRRRPARCCPGRFRRVGWRCLS